MDWIQRGPYFNINEHFIVMREPLVFSFHWINENVCFMFIILHEKFV